MSRATTYKMKTGLRLLDKLGSRIKMERLKQDKSLLECANAGGLTETQWAALERGGAKGSMSLVVADRVAAALGKGLDWYLVKK